MYESYRVMRRFQWRGFSYAPEGACSCECSQPGVSTSNCTQQTGTGCKCPDNGYCGCGIPAVLYAGSTWLVEENHPRKAYLIARRFVVFDPSLQPGDKLATVPKFQKFLGSKPIEGRQDIIVLGAKV